MVGRARILFVSTVVVTCGLSLTKEVGAIDGDYTGLATRVTPFDSRYQRIERYLGSKEPLHSQGLRKSKRSDSFDHTRILKRYLKIASRFEYTPEGTAWGDTSYNHYPFRSQRERYSSDFWQLPEETEGRGAGDCEDKAIWLYARLIQTGFENVRLVVGKYRVDQPAYHAWVVCILTGKIYILDPTINEGLWEARHYPKGFYKPVYSYSKDGRWHHTEGYRQLLATAPENRSD